MNNSDHSFITNSLSEAKKAIDKFSSDENSIASIQKCIEQCISTIKRDGIILACGNGGSMCDSNHFVEELTGYFRKKRRSIKAIAINDAAHISCVSNDLGFDSIFSRYVEAFDSRNNTLLVLSTSGNSPNVIKAVKIAKIKGMHVLGLLGKTGGELKNLVDTAIVVDGKNSDRIQEIHIKIIHIIVEGIERSLFPENYPE